MTKWKDFKQLYNVKFNHNTKIIDFRSFFVKENFKSNKIELISIGNSSLF